MDRRGLHACCIVVYDVLFSHKKAWDSDACDHMENPEDTMISGMRRPQKDKYCVAPLTRGSQQTDSQRQRPNRGCPGLRSGCEGLTLNGHRVSVWEEEEVLEVDSDGQVIPPL